jgi:hypothetical protein
MQTCSRCNTLTTDQVTTCPRCQADLRQFSTTAVALARLVANPRVSKVRVAAPSDSCLVCMQAQGVYEKDAVPRLPVDGCSEAGGCRCFYEPILTEIFP